MNHPPTGDDAMPSAPAAPIAPAAPPTIDDIYRLALDCDLAHPQRRELLMPEPALRASIALMAKPTDQLAQDLRALAGMRDADDRPIRLAQWLRAAASVLRHRPESEQFAAWAEWAEHPHAFQPAADGYAEGPSERPANVRVTVDRVDRGSVGVVIGDVVIHNPMPPASPWLALIDRRSWGIVAVAGLTAAAALGWWFLRDRPLDWPGPAPVVVELPTGPLRVDRDEASRADLGDCHLPRPPADQRAWCSALAGVISADGITVDDITDAPIAGTRHRSVVRLSPATAEGICALRGMRLPRDDEFTALLALGQPAWPDDAEAIATLAHLDERGPQIKHLATGAAEFVRVAGGHRVRGVPMLSAPATRVIAMAPSKARHEITAPPLAEAVAGPDTGFRCVGDIE